MCSYGIRASADVLKKIIMTAFVRRLANGVLCSLTSRKNTEYKRRQVFDVVSIEIAHTSATVMLQKLKRMSSPYYVSNIIQSKVSSTVVCHPYTVLLKRASKKMSFSPLLRVTKTCRTNNILSSVPKIVQFFTQFCTEANCTIKLSVYWSRDLLISGISFNCFSNFKFPTTDIFFSKNDFPRFFQVFQINFSKFFFKLLLRKVENFLAMQLFFLLDIIIF